MDDDEAHIKGTLRERDREGEIAIVPTADSRGDARRVVSGMAAWKRGFSALRHYRYRLFFGGQAISLFGWWIHMVAFGWVVYDLSDSEFTLGLINFMGAIPVLLLSVFAGAFADRVPKLKILFTTQSGSMVLSATLATLALGGWIQVWHIGAIGFGLGICSAFDIPARQSFIVELVGKDDLMNAIALNSSLFNAARVIGPAIGGIVISLFSAPMCFLLNTFSYLGPLTTYSKIGLNYGKVHEEGKTGIGKASLEAIQFVWENRMLRAIMGMVVVSSIFGWPYSVLLPVFARDILGSDASGYGMLMSANGIGAFLGAMTLALFGNESRRFMLFFGGVFTFPFGLMIFAASRLMWLSLLSLVLIGFGMIIFFATANTSIQVRSPDRLRGRIMGIYTVCFIGIAPIGSLFSGALAKMVSSPFTVTLDAIVVLIAAVWTYRSITKLRKNGNDALEFEEKREESGGSDAKKVPES